MRFSSIVPIALALFVAACATPTRIVQQWDDTTYAGGPFRRLLVVGVTQDSTLRRVFEDEFSAQLRARNVEAVQSYTLLPEDGRAPRERIERAVREAKADGVVMTRVLRVERRTEIVPSGPPVFGPGFWGTYSAAWGGPLWVGYPQPATVFQFDQVYVESTLHSVAADRLVWSAVSEVFAPRNPREDSADYSRVILDALAARKLI